MRAGTWSTKDMADSMDGRAQLQCSYRSTSVCFNLSLCFIIRGWSYPRKSNPLEISASTVAQVLMIDRDVKNYNIQHAERQMK